MTVAEIEMPTDKKYPKGFTFQLRCERDWLDVVTQEARRLQMSAAAYIRLAVQKELEATGAFNRHKKKRKD